MENRTVWFEFFKLPDNKKDMVFMTNSREWRLEMFDREEMINNASLMDVFRRYYELTEAGHDVTIFWE